MRRRRGRIEKSTARGGLARFAAPKDLCFKSFVQLPFDDARFELYPGVQIDPASWYFARHGYFSHVN